MEGSAQQVDSGTAGWMKCITVNIMWKVDGEWYCGWSEVCYIEHFVEGTHNRWTVVLQVQCSVTQWTLCGRYYTADGQWYCRLNEVWYSKHYVEDTAQQGDSGIADWVVLQWTLRGRYCTAGGLWYCSLNGVLYSEYYMGGIAQQVDSSIAGWIVCVTVNIM